MSKLPKKCADCEYIHKLEWEAHIHKITCRGKEYPVKAGHMHTCSHHNAMGFWAWPNQLDPDSPPPSLCPLRISEMGRMRIKVPGEDCREAEYGLAADQHWIDNIREAGGIPVDAVTGEEIQP